ncbi:hypothetical protein T492DRAFT_1008469 [Pavlovales sp. CCMP2436]|nr:hypothetical protein T492DRAFT_1008469 [Pavlovales sp. CCMP2436]|eukprot:CAMPEP_0179854722 /NCGR_PEP_ID=MMETSP0982-20121206/10104_1 /TAXON_ID=483367 /ORGANISM="non described non described, Strain CCMP 2436" /LENGTH=145 /DNA_ID=CAMNT_0021740665 /DNA_START=15 /DNA_END=452 /DNA_ORIENTATION=+
MADFVLLLASLPWLVLAPFNVVKVLLNKRSPIAHKIVHPVSEKCQSECGIARMWATCFWSAQFFLAAILLAAWARSRTRPIGAVADIVLIVAAAKFAIGSLLLFNYTRDIVREPVAIGGAFEIVCALLLIRSALANTSQHVKKGQ